MRSFFMNAVAAAAFIALVACVTTRQLGGQATASTQPSKPATQVWSMQDSGTTASLRGIDSVDGNVAWASGTEGTVLKTTDGGAHWSKCAVPDGDKDGATLDFRGVQAFDADTAIVMASGPGVKSRIYKTTDGCKIWMLAFTNPEKEGFYDALLFVDRQHGLVLGDPAHGDPRINPVEGGYFTFRIRVTHDQGKTWVPVTDPEVEQPGKNLQPLGGEAFFAASNSSMAFKDGRLWVATSHNRILRRSLQADGFESGYCAGAMDPFSRSCGIPWMDLQISSAPLAKGSVSAGTFSVAFRNDTTGITVGGDYTRANDSTSTAAYTLNGGLNWTAAKTPPHGYRSTVQWGESVHAWITAGTNGSDISRDDGRTWQPLDNGNWNALSLPFIVGPKGRIARLNPDALPPKN
jgi:photosystem II stability/assembly factor-like uncharacterized protein